MKMGKPSMRTVVSSTTVTALIGASLVGGSATVSADTAPADKSLPATVAADALPTPQHNGVGWKQVIVGNTVFVGGKFTSATPAGGGAASARSNLLSYDLTSGVLKPFAPQLNGQVMAMAASPDKSTLYIGGDFTSVDGKKRFRVAAFNANTGALLPFAPMADARVSALAASGDKVFIGGTFSKIGANARAKLAAVKTGSGELLPWNPGANSRVLDLVVSKDGRKVVAAGAFDRLAGRSAAGHGAIDAASGAGMPWGANQVVRNSGDKSAIYSLHSDGEKVYGTGYDFGTASEFENAYAARWSDGGLEWVNGCAGDTYSSTAMNGVLYTVGHAHDCSMAGGKPQTDPWTYQHILTMSSAKSPKGRSNTKGEFRGRPTSEILHFYPELQPGSFTGQNQAAWSIASSNGYVVVAGEFTKVNGVNQRGMTRFVARDKAPNKVGPAAFAAAPGVNRGAGGKTVVRWRAAWDRDNALLSYDVTQGGKVLATVKGESNPWNTPAMSAEVTAAANTPIVVTAKDPLGNVVKSQTGEVGGDGGGAGADPGDGGGDADPGDGGDAGDGGDDGADDGAGGGGGGLFGGLLGGGGGLFGGGLFGGLLGGGLFGGIFGR